MENPLTRAICDALKNDTMIVKEIYLTIGKAQSQVSKQLAIMSKYKIVIFQKKGYFKEYRINNDVFKLYKILSDQFNSFYNEIERKERT